MKIKPESPEVTFELYSNNLGLAQPCMVVATSAFPNDNTESMLKLPELSSGLETSNSVV